jgi:hypothetical protein
MTSASAPSSSPATIDDVQRALLDLRQFITRRFDEVSFEVNATGQLVGMSEEAMRTRFTEIMTNLNAVAFKGDGNTPHNVGVELEAVVKTTEDAANRILDAATDISSLTRKAIDWNDTKARGEFLGTVNGLAETILTACAFQDLTGQRIAATLENIRKAEAELADTLRRMGLKIDVKPVEALQSVAGTRKAHSQEDIDKLFA